MEDLNKFTWRGEKGEPIKFADLSETEQRVALIAAGALLHGGARRHTEVTLPEPETELAV
jgi:hypothetical protein